MHYTGKTDKENNTVYMYTNKINSKVYIGRTMQPVSIRAGANGIGYRTCTKFWNAIKKHGWNSFELTILAENVSYEESVCLEEYYIKQYRSNEQNYGYNILSQEPNRGHIPEEVKNKIRESKKRLTPEQRKRISESHMGQVAWNKGLKTGPLTAEQKKNFSNARKGNRNSIHVPVKCIETGQIFRSGAEAARAINRTGNAVFAAIARGRSCNGYHFERVNEEMPNDYRKPA